MATAANMSTELTPRFTTSGTRPESDGRQRRQDAHRADGEARVQQGDGDGSGDAGERPPHAGFGGPRARDERRRGHQDDEPRDRGERRREQHLHTAGGETAEEVRRAVDERPDESQQNGDHPPECMTEPAGASRAVGGGG